MITYYGGANPLANDYLIKMMQNDTYLQSIFAKRWSVKYPRTADQPVYPMGTITVNSTGDDPSIDQIQNAFISIDLFSQENVAEISLGWDGIDPITKAAAGVRKLLHNRSYQFTEVTIAKMWVVWVNTGLYDEVVRAWHLSARLSAKIVARTLVI